MAGNCFLIFHFNLFWLLWGLQYMLLTDHHPLWVNIVPFYVRCKYLAAMYAIFPFHLLCYSCHVFYICIHCKPHTTVIVILFFTLASQFPFKDIKTKKIRKYFIFTHIFHLSFWSHPFRFNFPSVLSPSPWNTFLSMPLSCRFAGDRFCFYLSENVFISPILLKDIFH